MIMAQRIDLFVSGIIAAHVIAFLIVFPAAFRAGRRLSLDRSKRVPGRNAGIGFIAADFADLQIFVAVLGTGCFFGYRIAILHRMRQRIGQFAYGTDALRGTVCGLASRG